MGDNLNETNFLLLIFISYQAFLWNKPCNAKVCTSLDVSCKYASYYSVLLIFTLQTCCLTLREITVPVPGMSLVNYRYMVTIILMKHSSCH
jgi:hypothetical protein